MERAHAAKRTLPRQMQQLLQAEVPLLRFVQLAVGPERHIGFGLEAGVMAQQNACNTDYTSASTRANTGLPDARLAKPQRSRRYQTPSRPQQLI
jgi:hypothetical protein